MLQTCIAKGNGIELLQASCTAITRYLLALSCKCCSSRRFPFQLVQVLGLWGEVGGGKELEPSQPEAPRRELADYLNN